MDNGVPCGSPTDAGIRIGSSSSSGDSCLGETEAPSSNDGTGGQERFCSRLWNKQEKQLSDDCLVNPDADQCCESRQNNNTAMLIAKEKIGGNGCWLVRENSLSVPENFLVPQASSLGVQSADGSCCNSGSNSSTNRTSSTEFSPLASGSRFDDPEIDSVGCAGDSKSSSPKIMHACSLQPTNSQVNFIGAALTKNGSCRNCRTTGKGEKNNLLVARPKEKSRDDLVSNNISHHHPQHCDQWRHRHHYSQPHQVNIPIEGHHSVLGDSNQNAAKRQPRYQASTSENENVTPCHSLKSVAATDPQSQSSDPRSTAMPYNNNCLPFKQGQLVHGYWPLNGSTVCTPKCCMVRSPNGLVIAPDFKSIDVNKMTQQASSHLHHHHHHNNNNHLHHKKKHASVAELVNYKNGHEAAATLSGASASTTKTVLLLQSNLNSPQSLPQQRHHACKCEQIATNSQANSSVPISSSSQLPIGNPPTICANCNAAVNGMNNGNMGRGSSGPNATNGNLVSKKCKALHNLQCKFQKNRFISSFQDCCRACNSYDGCRGSTESLELEAGLLCPSYSYCDSENVTSMHNSNDNHNYKNQLASLVNEGSGGSTPALPLRKSNNCLSTSACQAFPYNLQTNNFGSESPSYPGGAIAAGHYVREEDIGDFIDADFPPAPNSGRLMSSSTDSTESGSSLASSDMHDASSPNQQATVTPMNNIATPISERTPSHGGVVSLCSTFFKNCDFKKNNETSSAMRTTQSAASYSSPSVTGANPSLKKCSKATSSSSSRSPLPAACSAKLVEGNSGKLEQASSVIKCSEVSKLSSLLSSSSLSAKSPISSPSSSSSSPSSASFPTCSFLCSGDRHSHAKHKVDKTTSSDSGSRPTADTSSNSRSSGNSCLKKTPSPLPLASVSAAAGAQVGPTNSSAPSLVSPEVDFLDFDLMECEPNVNSAGSSNGTAAFDFSLYEIPYADDVDSACQSPIEELSPSMVIGAAGGSLTSHPVLANCATNDLSASSSNSNLSSRSTLEDATLPLGHSNFETVRTRVQNAFSNLYLDYRDDISVDSEDTGSHDSNEISEGDDQLANHHRRHHCSLTLATPNSSFNNNLLVSTDSMMATRDIDLRENPGVSEPIYEDIDGVNLDKCTADSPGDKCCCVAPDVSACGPIAVLNVLNAFEYPIEKSKVLEKAPVNLRDTSTAIAPYLFSRAKAGTTAEVLIKCVESVTNGAIRGRFFAFHPQRDVHLLKWLGEWMKKDAVPLATLNIQKSVPDPWHHQMIHGVSCEGVYLTNSLKLVSEECLMHQLTSDSILLIPRFDVISRYTEETNLSQLMSPKNSNKWRTMNVLGQVVNVLREANMPRPPGYQPQLTQHIRIPAAYRAGITLFIRSEAEAFHELMNAADLPLKVDSPSADISLPSPSKEVDGDDDEASGGCCISHPDHCAERCSRTYNSYEYADNNYDGGSSARIAPSVNFGSGPSSLDMDDAGAAAAALPDSSNSIESLHSHLDLHEYSRGSRYIVNHGYPRRNNMYIHYFKS